MCTAIVVVKYNLLLAIATRVRSSESTAFVHESVFGHVRIGSVCTRKRIRTREDWECLYTRAYSETWGSAVFAYKGVFGHVRIGSVCRWERIPTRRFPPDIPVPSHSYNPLVLISRKLLWIVWRAKMNKVWNMQISYSIAE